MADAKVIQLVPRPKAPPAPPPPEPNADIVETLRGLLARAESGELQAIAFTTMGEGNVCSYGMLSGPLTRLVFTKPLVVMLAHCVLED